MNERLEKMAIIQQEKEREMQTKEQQPLNPEGKALAEKKKMTIDVPYVVTDPLR